MIPYPHNRLRRQILFWLALLAALTGRMGTHAEVTPLVTLQYKIIGTQLKVSPAALSVPKGIPGSILVEIANGDGSPNTTETNIIAGAHVEATLRGPSFPARRLVGRPNEALLLPALNLVGDYQLDDIKLVDDLTGEVRLEGTPGSVPVKLFDEVLISHVVSRPLDLKEIRDKGIAIDDQNFRAVEFEVGFVLDGKKFPVKFPVVAPTFSGSTEIIPTAEKERRTVEAQSINSELQRVAIAELPQELERAALNLQVTGINFELADVAEKDLRLPIPPIPALIVIPGNVGYLNQFFSVQIFTENGAPGNSGLSVFNMKAELVLPPGPDLIRSTNYAQPGDDPLRFARVGPNKIVEPILPLARPGPDGIVGTADDIGRLYPGETAQAEFLVEGLQEGLHVMDVNITADLEGLAAGVVKIKGKAAGSVLVRNPEFSLSFSHPKTVRSGEPYDAYVTLLNTSSTVANLVSISLAAASLSGGVLESPSTVQLDTIAPGQSKTAKFRVRPQRTGKITFSNLTTGEDSIQGRFKLRMGIDERGVELSPDTIGLPPFVYKLAPGLVDAANRVLGQALSVATAGQLPSGVKPVSRNTITRRVLELAEAGQRLSYGDESKRVLMDVLFDWQGGRNFNDGFDQIMIMTDAGREFRTALMSELEKSDTIDATSRVLERGPDVAGRSEAWTLASVSAPNVEISFVSTNGAFSLDTGTVPQSGGYRGGNGAFVVTRGGSGAFRWEILSNSGPMRLSVLALNTNGAGRQLTWSVDSLPGGACLNYWLDPTNAVLEVASQCDRAPEQFLSATVAPIAELPPIVMAVMQDREVNVARPHPSCNAAASENYGTVLGVLFSKPLTAELVSLPDHYFTDNGYVANSVQIQSGGRVALLNMSAGVGSLKPRTLTVTNLTDLRGNRLITRALPLLTPIGEGVAIRGRVVRIDGSPAVSVPVTLTMNDTHRDPFDRCDSVNTGVTQVFTDENGEFTFDFVLAGVPYTISSTDTGGLSREGVEFILKNSKGDKFQTERILTELVHTNILQALGTATLPDAIALAEGLDRATWTDVVPLGTGRVGSELIVALRFRGRGVVRGKIVLPDGSPVFRAAVNLFPDPDSREQGRGLFTETDGKFAFYGVPLGNFSLQVKNAAGQFRIVSGLLNNTNRTNDVTVVLTAPTPGEVIRSSLGGRVVEPDNVTVHPRARLYLLGDAGAIAATSASAEGQFLFDDIPVGLYTVMVISSDSRRKGTRTGILVSAGTTNFVSVALTGTGRVVGRVETSSGVPVANALVSGGLNLARTDANGFFVTDGVPLGSQSISAGLEGQYAAGGFPRFGSGGVEVLPGIDNFVVIRLRPAAQIVGQVRDAEGHPVPLVKVAVPVPGGFMWVKADAGGFFKFQNVGLGQYYVSAPSPPVTEKEGEEDAATPTTDEDVIKAVTQALTTFLTTTSADPKGQAFDPGAWGFTTAQLRFDGDTAIANITYLPQGSVSGTVLNHQAVPIGARVRLTGIGPQEDGSPGLKILGEQNSDPAEGTFAFPHRLPTGDWGIQVASPFYPIVIQQSGRTTLLDLDVTNLVMQFPPLRQSNGRLKGQVFYPDGTTVSNGVDVKISFGTDYVIHTDTNGIFDTQILIPANTYTVEVFDNNTGLKGMTLAAVTAGITNFVNVYLLGLGDLQITARQGNGLPASNAFVRVHHGSYPPEEYSGLTDSNGVFHLENIFVGPYSVEGTYITGYETLPARASANVSAAITANATLVFAGTANIAGRFLDRDGKPVPFARISIGSLAFLTTDTNGNFLVNGLSLGQHRVVASDQTDGGRSSAEVALQTVGETAYVTLVKFVSGEIRGVLSKGTSGKPLPGEQVVLSLTDGANPNRTVTTGPDGSYYFPGVPPGPFNLNGSEARTRSVAFISSIYPDNTPSLNLNLVVPDDPLLGSVMVQVFQPGGVLPATNASVTLSSLEAFTSDTDSSGVATFSGLRMGDFRIFARSLATSEDLSAGKTNGLLSSAQTNVTIAVTLAGVGKVTGKVFESDGVRVAVGAEVHLVMLSTFFPGAERVVLTDTSGNYSVSDVAAGDFQVRVRLAALAATASGSVLAGTTNSVNLILGQSGSVTGILVRADGVTRVTNLSVTLTYPTQSGLDGLSIFRTDSNGAFRFDDIPIGTNAFIANWPAVLGFVEVDSMITTNGQVVNLGTVALDEDFLSIRQMTPPPDTINVPTTSSIDILFNETVLSNSISRSGIVLRTGTNVVGTTLRLLPDPTNGIFRLLRIVPDQPLRSDSVYDLLIFDGTRQNATGEILGSGPTDRFGRPLVTPFLAHFITRDDDPPLIVSQTPSNNAVQIDPRAVVRVTFNEPIRPTNFTFTLTGPNGPVDGSAAVGLNATALVFTPAAALAPNAVYQYELGNVRDLAGNLSAVSPIRGTFNTLDTMGPVINSLRIADGKSPVAGGSVFFEALLAGNEPGASVRFTLDLNPIAVLTNPPYRIPLILPSTGTFIVRAIATDQYGNDGPLAELPVTIVSNTPPVVTFTRLSPSSGKVQTGQGITLALSASDDNQVTNVSIVSFGSIAIARQFADGSPTNLTFIVPTSAVADSTISFRAQATDSSGATSPEARIDLVVSDTVTPVLQIVSPAPNEMLNPSVPLEFQFATADNSSNVTAQLILSGALMQTQTLVIAQVPNQFATNHFTISLDQAATNGTILSAFLRVTDSSTNTAIAFRNFRLPDRTPPRLLSVNPTNHASAQSIWLSGVQFSFSENIGAASATAAAFSVTNNAGLSNAFQIDPQLNVINLRPILPTLAPGVTYTNILLPGLTDDAGNPVVDGSGQALPPEGLSSDFTTAALRVLSPTNGQRLVAGQNVSVSLEFEPGLGADFFRFAVGTNPPVDVSAVNRTNITLTVGIATNATNGIIAISAHHSGAPVYVLPAVVLNVRPRAADDDGDGWSNGFEIDHGMNPFMANLDSEDFDGDGLTNGEEKLWGTDPSVADTDHDGLTDGYEVHVSHTDPLNPDTDGDGIPDGLDSDPNNRGRAPSIALPNAVEIVQNVSTNVVVVATDLDNNLRRLEIAGGGSGNTVLFYNLAAYGSVSSLSQINFNAAPASTGTFTSVNYDSTGGSFWIGGPADLFAAKFTGAIIATNAGTYTFYITSDDGSVLYLDGSQVAAADGLHGMQEAAGSVTLEAGTHSFELRYFENFGGAGMILAWSGPGISKQVIPPSAFSSIRTYWLESGTPVLDSTNNVSSLTGHLVIEGINAVTGLVRVIARDVDGLSTTQSVAVTVLADLDGDGIPDRDDPDIDGDGLSNADEMALGTNPRDPDSDHDGIPDGLDRLPLVPNRRPVAGVLSGSAALQLDGVDDYVDLGNWFNLQEFTVGLWVKPGATQQTYADIIDNNHRVGVGWVMQQNVNEINHYGLGLADGGPGISFSLQSNRWQYLVFSRDSNRITRLFIDGQLVGTSLGTSDINYIGIQQLSLGRWGGGGRNWNGSYDQVAMWNRALPDGQLTTNYQQTLTGSETNLVGLWKFDEGSGSISADLSGNGRAAQLGGGSATLMPAWVRGIDQATFLNVTGNVLQAQLNLPAQDPDGDPFVATVRLVAGQGKFYQTADGTNATGIITNGPLVLGTNQTTVLYVPPRGIEARDYLEYEVTDGYLVSGLGVVLVHVVPDPLFDFDGDGMPDVWEVAHNLNPYVNDAGLDPDADGLTNLQEFQHGTDPDNADTDGDGLSDGVEVAMGTNPLNPDTDGDGLRDDVDPDPLHVNSGVIFTGASSFTVTEGGATNVTLDITSASSPLVSVDFSPTNMPPSFIHLDNISITNGVTNGTGHAQLFALPSFDHAGSYSFTVRGVAADGGSGVATITVTVLDDNTTPRTAWKDAVSGNFEDPTRWTDGVPDTAKEGMINLDGSYTVTVNSSRTVGRLFIGNTNGTVSLNIPGTLIVQDVLTLNTNTVVDVTGRLSTTGKSLIAGSMNWLAGNIDGPGRLVIGPLGSWSISGPDTKGFYGTVANYGLARMGNSGPIYFGSAHYLNGGTTLSTNVNFTYNGGVSEIVNAGTWIQASGTSTAGIAFYQGGTLDIDGGFNLSGGGSAQGRTLIRTNSTLTVQNPYTFGRVSAITGAGTFQVNSGATLQGLVDITGWLYVAGSIDLQTNLTLPRINLTGTINGVGDLTVSDRFVWTLGNLSPGGRLIIAPGALLSLPNENARGLSRVIENHGTADFTAAAILYFGNGTLYNAADGQLLLGAAQLTWNGGANLLSNAGTMIKTGAVANVGVRFENSGLFNLAQGRVDLRGDGFNSGSFVTASNTILSLGNYTFGTNSMVAAAGQVAFESTVNVAGRFELQQPLAINGAANFLTPVSLPGATLLGSINGSGTVTMTGDFSWPNGSLSPGGNLVIAAGVTAVVNNAYGRSIGRMIENHGSLIVSNGATLYFGNGSLYNAAEGVVTVANASFVWNGGYNFITNAGTINKVEANAGALFSVALYNGGMFNLLEGRMDLNGDGANYGQISAASNTVFVTRNYTFITNSLLRADGYVGFDGSVVVEGALELSQPLVINGPTTINRNTSLPGLTLNTTLAGSGDVTISNFFNFVSGSLSGSGRTIIATNCFMAMTNANGRSINRILENFGTLSMNLGAVVYCANGTIINRAGGTWNLEDATIYWNGGYNVMTNFGAFNKVGTNTYTYVGIYFCNQGSIDVRAGVLDLGGGGLIQSNLTVWPGASLIFRNGFDYASEASIQGGGQFIFRGGTHVLPPGFNPTGPVLMEGGNVTVSSPITPAGLLTINNTLNFTATQTLSGVRLFGNLYGSQPLTIADTFDWRGGNLGGTGALIMGPGSQFFLTNGAGVGLSRPLQNQGTMEIRNGSVLYVNSAALSNDTNGVMRLSDGFIYYGGGGPYMVNAGTIEKVGPGNFQIGIYLVNDGTINVTGGTLDLRGGGANRGTIYVAAGATLLLSTEYQHSPGSSITGPGNIVFAGGTQVLSPNFNITGSISFDGGNITISNAITPNNLIRINNTVAFQTPQVFSSVYLQGTLQGVGDVTVMNSFDWRGGDLRGTGSLIMAPGSQFSLTNGAGVGLSRPLQNQGTMEIRNGSVLYVNSAALSNDTNGVMRLSDGFIYYGGGGPYMVNAGTIEKVGPGNFQIGIYLVNDGTINVTGGTLDLRGGGANRGTIYVAAGATLLMASEYQHSPGSSITGPGNIVFAGGTQVLSPNFNITGSISFDGGNITISNAITPNNLIRINNTVTFQAPQVFSSVLLQGTLQGVGDVNVANRFDWRGGELRGTGTLIMDAGSQFSLTNGAGVGLSRPFQNHGTMEIGNGSVLYVNSAALSNDTNGVMRLSDGFIYYGGGGPYIVNAGTIEKVGPGYFQIGIYLVNDGAINVAGGTLDLRGGGANRGTINVAAGATLLLSTEYQHSPGSSITGPGNVVFAGGNHVLSTNFNITGSAAFNAGNVTVSNRLSTAGPTVVNGNVSFQADQYLDSVQLFGAIQGGGNVVVSNIFDWKSGTLAGGGNFSTGPGSRTEMTNGMQGTLNRTLLNYGLLEMDQAASLYLNGGVILNQTGAVARLGEGSLNYSGGSPGFGNYGTVTKNGSGVFSMGIYFDQRAAVQVDDGTLSLYGSGWNGGVVSLGATATISYVAGYYTFADSSRFSGNGTVNVRSGTQWILSTNLYCDNIRLGFLDSSTVTGAYLLSNNTNGQFRFEHSMTIPGSMDVAGSLVLGSSLHTVQINGTLTLENGSTLTNPGTLRVGAFIDNGGTIVGNAPVVVPGLATFRIDQIQLSNGNRPTLALEPAPKQVVMHWRGNTAQTFIIQQSTDLRQWNAGAAAIIETAPGIYQGTVTASGTGPHFFRLMSVNSR